MQEYKPEECIYDKSYICPVCDAPFKAKAIRKGKARFLGNDFDLKPNYTPIQPDYYDVIVCNICGYAAISLNFDKITYSQQDAVREEISKKYVSQNYPAIYDVDTAISRYLLALENCEAKKAKAGEIAYINLKLAWFYRDKKDKENELKYLEEAYNGFSEAFTNEKLPICGLDENTLLYILAAIGVVIGKPKESLLILGKLVIKKDLTPRLKDKIVDLREELRTVLEKIKVEKA